MDASSMPADSAPVPALDTSIPTGDERDVPNDTASHKNKRTEEAEEQPVSKKLKEDNAEEDNAGSEKHAPEDQAAPADQAAPKKFDKRLKHTWKLSSDDADHPEPLEEDEVLSNITNKSLIDIFKQNFDNLVTVVMLMMEKGMHLVVSGAFVDPDEAYIKQGKYDYEKITDMREVPAMFIVSVGSIEKVLIPGLQIIYSLGFDQLEHEGDDYSMYVSSTTSEIDLSYKFNDRDCKLKIVGAPKGGRFDQVQMIMYVED